MGDRGGHGRLRGARGCNRRVPQGAPGQHVKQHPLQAGGAPPVPGHICTAGWGPRHAFLWASFLPSATWYDSSGKWTFKRDALPGTGVRGGCGPAPAPRHRGAVSLAGRARGTAGHAGTEGLPAGGSARSASPPPAMWRQRPQGARRHASRPRLPVPVCPPAEGLLGKRRPAAPPAASAMWALDLVQKHRLSRQRHHGDRPPAEATPWPPTPHPRRLPCAGHLPSAPAPGPSASSPAG